MKTVQTYRGPPAGWNAPNNQPTFQLLLQDDELVYDSVGNPTEIRDWRIASEWPAGAKPVTKKAQYDDLYRVSRVDYQYEGGDDAWKSPFDAENSGQTDLQDPRRAKPSPHVNFDKRVEWQTFEYDWVGNTKTTDDDARGFYDRSLGPITNDTAKPYQLKSADNTALGGTRTGKLDTQYDAAGNLSRLQVKRNGTCLPAGSSCSQVFSYEWDEVGRLSRARRWDVATPPAITDPLPTAAPSAHLRFGYDAGDQRVIKTAVDDAAPNPETAGRHTVYVFESLELRRAVFAPGSGPSEVPDYELSKWTEVPYLYAHGVRLARVAWDEPDVPTVGGKETHVLLELGDHLGSTSVVFDRDTGEVVERGTYQAYGSAESDYRPERWKGFREDYRFTGKEEDVEVGLQYFGKRYYAPALNQWLSADPLEIHASGGSSDQNSYAYVGGKALKNTDPQGLTVPCANRCEEVAFPLGSPVVPLQEWVASWKEAESLPGPAKWAIRAALINYSPQYVSEALSRATSGADLLLAGVGGSRVAGKAAYRLTALLAGRKATPEVVGLLRGVGKASFGEQGRGWSIIKKLGLHKSIAADFAKLSGKAWAQGRDALFSMNPTVRGELGEQILAHGEYKGWKHVGELNDGKFRAVDFQKGNVQAQVATFDAADLSDLKQKLRQLEGTAKENPGMKFVLDVRTRYSEQATRVLSELRSNVVKVKASQF